MIENIGLEGFVLRPRLNFAKDVDFYREAVLGRLELAHQEGHARVNFG